ncbi:type II secretory pathway component HofQ [Bradyrhizobium diazoefficiens]
MRPDILLREEALRDQDEQVDRQAKRGEEDRERGTAPGQGMIEDVFVAPQHPVKGALAPLVELAVGHLAMGAQEARGHHRRQRQRHEHRDEDGHRQHDGELAEQTADDAAHQQQRDQHRDQRDADRDDREADFLRTLEGGRHRRFAFLDVAGDVLEHHDGVVDNKSDCDRECHQRQIVE